MDSVNSNGTKVSLSKGNEIIESESSDNVLPDAAKVSLSKGNEVIESEVDNAPSGVAKVSLSKGNEIIESESDNVLPGAAKVSLSKGNEVIESEVDNTPSGAVKVSLSKGNEVIESEVDNAPSGAAKVSLSKGNKVIESEADSVLPGAAKVSLSKGNEVIESEADNVLSGAAKVILSKGNEVIESEADNVLSGAAKVSLSKGNEGIESEDDNAPSGAEKIGLTKDNEISEIIVDSAEFEPENAVEFSDNEPPKLKYKYRASGNTGNSNTSSSDMLKSPAAMKKNRINSYLEEDDEDAVLNNSVPVIESGRRKTRIVPILIAVIFLLCAGIILLLFSYRNLMPDSTQMVDKGIYNGNENISPVVSQNNNTESKQIYSEIVTEKSGSLTVSSEKVTEKAVVEHLTLEESNQFVEVGAGSESSRKILMNYLPELYDEMSTNSGIVMGNEKFDANSFSICDIDSDGEAELLVKIITGPMAAKALYIYKADSSGKVVKEASMSNESVFYKNGLVKSPLNHNQGKGTLWPYGVEKYDSALDTYTSYYSLDSWSKAAYPEGFPDEIDVSSTGVVYFISNNVNGEKSTCDYTDYVKWFNSWNQCSPKLNISFESFSEANVKKYAPDFQKAETHNYVGKGYVSTRDDDLNLRKSASTDSNVLTTIPKNTKLELYSSETSGWYFTSYNGVDGYVSADWVTLGEPPVTEKRNSYLGKGYVNANDVLNLRKSASTDSEVLTTIPKNTKLELYSADTSGWYYTSYNGKSGYVSADWVAFGEPPAVKPSTIYGLNPYLTGQISSGGKKIQGFTTDYVCYGGVKTVQWNCEDTWHITAKRRTSSYGVEWYECWDTDDGDYYGWIDSKFLSFYSSGSSNNQGNSINPVTNINPYRTGEISSNGKKIEGYTTDYVCNGGAKTAQWICEDTWHITARRKTSSYGVEWYECWDTDDGDYYGWIDGKFLRFY